MTYNSNTLCDVCPEDSIPPITIPAPPACEEGETCDDAMETTCIIYDGPAIPCMGILNNESLKSIIQKISSRLCDCCDGTLPVIDCVMSDWSAWSACEDGVQTRTRTVIQTAVNGGTACPEELTETRACCTDADCQVSEWGDWSDCVDGTRTRTRTIIVPPSCEGASCPALIETEACVGSVECQQPTNLTAEII